MRHVNELDRERPQHQRLARLHPVELRLLQHLVFFETPLHQRQRERGAVDRNLHQRQQERNPADVILVPVRQDQAAHVRGIFLQVRKIGRDDIDAHQFRVGEHHPRVENDNVIAIADRHAVHTELAQAAQRDDL